MSVVKSFFTVGFWTLVSRIFGFIRDIVMAAQMGTSPLAQAFMVAFKLPNFFRRLFAEGAFNSAFVPMFSGTLGKEGEEAALAFARQILGWMLFILSVFTIVMMLIMPWLMIVLAPGFIDDQAMFDLCITLTRITFPYLMLISLVAFFSGMLNSYGKFWVVAATPVLLNLTLIIMMLGFNDYFPTEAHTLSIGVTLAGLIQLSWVCVSCWKMKIRFLPSIPRLSLEMRLFFRRMGPGLVGAGVTQINLWFDVMVATFISGAVAYLYYADRIVQFPLSTIGTAMAVALLPVMSKHMRADNMEEALRIQARGIEMVYLLCLPASAIMISAALPMVTVLFERGEFNADSSVATAAAIAAFAFGLPAFIFQKLFSTTFFASGDTRTPVKYAMYCVVINIVLNVMFVVPLYFLKLMPHVAIVMATVCSSWVNVYCMRRKLQQLGKYAISARMKSKMRRIAFSALVMAIVTAGASKLLWPWLTPEHGNVTRIAALMAIFAIGLISYIMGLFGFRAIGADDIAFFKRVFKRRMAK